MKKYDIFISYKRKSESIANNLYYRLISKGYLTFYDQEEMGRDNYNVQLLSYIENSKDVFVIIEEGSLDACKKNNWKDDWFCIEIAHALKLRKNIIPILIGDYKMPKPDFFPEELKELSLKNAPEFSFFYFGEYLEKLIEKKYITSEAQIENKATSIFKFYSDVSCQVFRGRKHICTLESMSDEPYYYPVSRKGEYRFNIVLQTGKKLILESYIDKEEEKIIHIKNKKKLKPSLLYILCGLLVLFNISIITYYQYISKIAPTTNSSVGFVEPIETNKGVISTNIMEINKVQELTKDNTPATNSSVGFVD